MKRKIFKMFAVLAFLLCFVGCSDSSSTDEDSATYKIEAGVISNSTYTTAMNKISYWSEFSYSNIASLRLYLYNNTISDHEVQTGITLSEIKDFLLSKGMSNYETNTEIGALKTIGNDIAFFEHATDSSKKIWMYATK